MSEVLIQFSEAVRDDDGTAYTAQACGRVGENDLWEGWLEFIPLGGEGEPLRTARETTQPNRTDLAYWASGLTMIFLEGALARAKTPTRMVRRTTVDATPRFSEPAPATARPVLNPFAVFVQGEHVLRQELTALDTNHLRTILRAYAQSRSVDDMAADAELRERIVDMAKSAVLGGRESDTARSDTELPPDARL